MHVPSLASDYDKVTQEFKGVLGDLFDHTKIMTDTMDQMSVMPSTVAVKGPLSVQQYYDLSGNCLFYICIYIYIFIKDREE